MQDYIRSYQFVPPVCLFLLWTIVSYTYTPNPVLSSYGVSCAVLYFISAWMSVTIMQTTDSVQLQITIVNAKSVIKIFSSMILSVLVIISMLSAFAIFYPIMIGAFDRPVTLQDIFIAACSHLLISMLSISITIYLSWMTRVKTVSSWLLLVLVLLISLVKGGLVGVLPQFMSYITWVIPPAFSIVDLLGDDSLLINARLLLEWMYVLIYSGVLFFLFVMRIRKRNVMNNGTH
ncbi:hypothetical protein F3157_14700 [Virgibacillus dakarensis]|nr:hypothetical protein [Virgibacillus dakarensis]